MTKNGFTLIELVVVVVIIGILTSIGVSYYHKTVESSKATDAVAIAHLLSNANRMYRADNPNYVSGQITDSCNSATCSTASGGCKLVACGYVAKQSWDSAAYDFYVCNGGTGGSCCASNITACAKRKSGASEPYSTWTYKFTNDGRCQAEGNEVPDCPKF